jgi:type I restriction-modification system DNA methylase subunit
VRGKYRDVILPMMVLRRLDAVLESAKQAVLSMKGNLDKAGITNQDVALRQAAGQAFYNTSRFTLRDLRNRASQSQLKADFEAYLDGFSPNVQEILDNFEFRNQIPKLSKADVLGTLIVKFLDSSINLGPKPVLNGDGSVRHPGLDNHAMGTIFEELVRRFNEANNEEAGEHWTPRDAVKLMAKLIFVPIADQITSGTYLLYDGACGTAGMLTVADETLNELADQHGKQVSTHLFGQEINAETYAIAKADLLLKGEGEEADNIVGGPEWSTLANDAFPSREFDFMLSNPLYGKSWKSDQERMGGKGGMRDPRFVIEHAGDAEYSLVTRSSDGQMLFLANMLSKMKHNTPLGSRIAEVHNGSSLFTGDAGSGESNVRRWIIENDWLEAIVALPLNMFYNTGIATYVWVLTNRKPGHRRGQVQLIDATGWFKLLRKNLGKAVQTLSRLNRAHPQKHDVFVLDFLNDTETIRASFETFYRTTILSDETEPNRLHDLKANLDDYQVYQVGQIEQLVEQYLSGADRDRLDPILDACVASYNSELDEDGQVDFKGKAKAFARTYAFISSILPYTNANWEKLSIFLNFLLPKLPAPREEDLSKGILEAIDMDSYRVEKQAVQRVQLDQDAEIDPVPTDGGGHKAEPELDLLSNIIRSVNDLFGNIAWQDTDRIRKLIETDIPHKVAADVAYQNAKKNSDKQNARIEHDKVLAGVIVGLMKDDTELFKQFSDNPEFKRCEGRKVIYHTAGGP